MSGPTCFQAGTCPGAADPYIRWSYDGVGNRLTEARPGGTTSYAYDQMDRMLSAGAAAYTYDRSGNELSAGSRVFVYDLANRVKTTTLGSTTTTYAYDGDGVRLQASTGSQASKKTNFIWDVNHALPMVAREDNGSGSLQRRCVYGQRLIFMSTSSSNAWYYHVDPLGSVRNVTSSAGATQLTYDYEPYGAIRSSSGTSPTNFVKFTAEYQDPAGLYHLRARQYDPAAGRFLALDQVSSPLKRPGVSAYGYVDARPTVFSDSSGQTLRPADDGRFASWFAGSADATGASAAAPQEVLGPNVVPVEPSAPTCRITFTLPRFFDRFDRRWVQGQVLAGGCSTYRSVIVDVCVAQKYRIESGRYFNWIDPRACAGWAAPPDGITFSTPTECRKGSLWATAAAFDKTKTRIVVGRSSKRC